MSVTSDVRAAIDLARTQVTAIETAVANASTPAAFNVRSDVGRLRETLNRIENQFIGGGGLQNAW